MPPAPQERSGKEESGRSVRNDGVWGSGVGVNAQEVLLDVGETDVLSGAKQCIKRRWLLWLWIGQRGHGRHQERVQGRVEGRVHHKQRQWPHREHHRQDG